MERIAPSTARLTIRALLDSNAEPAEIGKHLIALGRDDSELKDILNPYEVNRAIADEFGIALADVLRYRAAYWATVRTSLRHAENPGGRP